MAGRDISVTHEALGAVRVMKTTGAMGEIVGMAAALCKQNDCDPREIYSRHLEELKSLMSLGAGRPVEADPSGDFQLTGRSARIRGTQLRYEPERDSLGYWRTSTDAAEWKIRVPVETSFDAVVTYACPESEAGASYALKYVGFSTSMTYASHLFRVDESSCGACFFFPPFTSAIFNISSCIVALRDSESPILAAFTFPIAASA